MAQSMRAMANGCEVVWELVGTSIVGYEPSGADTGNEGDADQSADPRLSRGRAG